MSTVPEGGLGVLDLGVLVIERNLLIYELNFPFEINFTT